MLVGDMFIAHLSSGSPRHENVVFGTLMCKLSSECCYCRIRQANFLYD
jgi:hypothetical protein